MIGPSVIDFGEVSLRTVNTKPLMIVNHLDIHVFIQIDIDCRELRQSLPLTQVVPPQTMSKVDITFESQKSGTFQRFASTFSPCYICDKITPTPLLILIIKIFETYFFTSKCNRSVVYTVNNHIKQHINVHARIVTPEIAISQSEIVLKPTIGVPQTYGRLCLEFILSEI